MKIKIDKTADALYITLQKGAISRTENRDGCLLDYDAENNLLGFEVLNFSEKIPLAERKSISIDDHNVQLAA